MSTRSNQQNYGGLLDGIDLPEITLLGTIRERLAALVDAIASYRRQRATRSALWRLDDRMLKDIGLDRSEIDSVVIESVVCDLSGERIRR